VKLGAEIELLKMLRDMQQERAALEQAVVSGQMSVEAARADLAKTFATKAADLRRKAEGSVSQKGLAVLGHNLDRQAAIEDERAKISDTMRMSSKARQDIDDFDAAYGTTFAAGKEHPEKETKFIDAFLETIQDMPPEDQYLSVVDMDARYGSDLLGAFRGTTSAAAVLPGSVVPTETFQKIQSRILAAEQKISGNFERMDEADQRLAELAEEQAQIATTYGGDKLVGAYLADVLAAKKAFSANTASPDVSTEGAVEGEAPSVPQPSVAEQRITDLLDRLQEATPSARQQKEAFVQSPAFQSWMQNRGFYDKEFAFRQLANEAKKQEKSLRKADRQTAAAGAFTPSTTTPETQALAAAPSDTEKQPSPSAEVVFGGAPSAPAVAVPDAEDAPFTPEFEKIWKRGAELSRERRRQTLQEPLQK